MPSQDLVEAWIKFGNALVKIRGPNTRTVSQIRRTTTIEQQFFIILTLIINVHELCMTLGLCNVTISVIMRKQSRIVVSWV